LKQNWITTPLGMAILRLESVFEKLSDGAPQGKCGVIHGGLKAYFILIQFSGSNFVSTQNCIQPLSSLCDVQYSNIIVTPTHLYSLCSTITKRDLQFFSRFARIMAAKVILGYNKSWVSIQ